MEEPVTGAPVKPPFDPKELSRLAAQGVFFGTSSWKYRGWEGIIYKGGYASEAQFQRQSLREYTSYFPCVGLDFTFYTWPLPEMMSYLLDATPDNFRLFPKVTKRITMREFPPHASYGRWAGQKNPDFLDAGLFREQFLEPMRRLAGRVGSILFEFTSLSRADLPAFERFFSEISREFPLGVEIRSPDLLDADFYRMLLKLEVSPVFNSWTRMPRIREQVSLYRRAGGGSTARPLVVRGLLRPGRSYEEAVQKFQPYARIGEEYPEVREDLVEFCRWVLGENGRAYVLINNRLEGSAPHTIGAVVEQLKRWQ